MSRRAHARVRQSVGFSALVAISGVLGAVSSVHAANAVWTGASSSNWNDAGNWSTSAVPTSADTVYLVTHNTDGTAVANLPTNLDISAGTLGAVYFTGSTAFSVNGNALTLNNLSTRFVRNVTYASGSTTATFSTTAGLQVGMVVPSGTGISAGTTIQQIVDGTTVILSQATTAAATNRSVNWESRASFTWNPSLTLGSAAQNWTVASGQSLIVNGNISGIGSIGNSYGESSGALELKGVNTYSGRSALNNGTIRVYGAQAASPNTTFGLSWGSVRFANPTAASEYAYTVASAFEGENGSGSIYIGTGGRVTFSGAFNERATAGLRGLKFFKEGSGTSVADLKGNVNLDGRISIDPSILVRLYNPLGQAYGGNTDITSSTDVSTIDGTLDLMGNNFDRKINANNMGGAVGAGVLVNSKLSSPSTVSGMFNNLGTNNGNRDFGGPGTLILTGALRVAPGATDTGMQKVGPGGVIVRSPSLVEASAGSDNPNTVFAGTLVLDHAANNGAKFTDDSLTIQNGRFVVLGNNSAATAIALKATGDLSIGGASDRGYAQIDLRSGTGAGLSFTFRNLAGLSDTEVVNFSVTDGGGGVPVINTSNTAGTLAPTITFGKTQWAQVSGGQIVGLNPNLTAADAATFQSSSGNTQDIDVTGSFTTSAVTSARTLRFAQAGDTALTLNSTLNLNLNGGTGSGILVSPGTGAVTIDGSAAIALGTNTSLTVHHNGANPLTIKNAITGTSGTELNKVGPGELVLENSNSNWNSSSGIAVGIYEGTVTVPVMTNAGVNSPIGTSTTIVIGNKNDINYATGVATQNPARFRYTGAGHATDRAISLVGVAEIEASGTGLLSFTKTGDVVTSVGNTGAWNDLILSGTGAGQFAGAIKLGVADLVKKGSGTWTLTNTSSLVTYGKLIVEDGTLVNNSTISVLTDVVVSGGKLTGAGAIGSPITIAAGAKLAPGNSPGVLNSGGATINGTLEIEANGTAVGTLYDQLAVTGTVTLGASSNLDFLLGYTPAANDTFVLINNDGLDAISGQFATVNGAAIAGGTFSTGSAQVQLNYAGGDGNDLVAMVTVIPEPSVLALASASLVSWSLLRRRVARAN